MHSIRALVLVAFAAVSSLPLGAQSGQRVSVQVSGLSTGIVANGGVINGFGIEPQMRVNAKYFSGVGMLSFGVGAQYSSHLSGDNIGITIFGAFAEPRLVIAKIATQRVSPYLAGRVAVLRQSNDVASSSGGIAIGGGGGIALTVSPRVNLDVGVSGIVQNFGLSTTSSGRRFIEGIMNSYAAKFGVSIGLGGS